MMRNMTMPMTGRITASEAVRGTSSRRAMMMPPMTISGALNMIVSPMATSICTCCTSLVFRVIREAVLKWLISFWEKLWTLRKSEPRMSRPAPMATRDAQYTPKIAAIPVSRATPSMYSPIRRM